MSHNKHSLAASYQLTGKLKKSSPPFTFSINKNTDGSLLLAIFPIILSLIIAISIFVLKDTLPPTLPLFYSLPWGEQQLAKIHQLLIIPATFLCISLINLIVFLQLNESFLIFKKILSLTSVIISLLLTISFFQIVSIFL